MEEDEKRVYEILNPYQRTTIQRTLKIFNGKALIALDAGLGKTITSLALIQKLDVVTVIVCPSALKLSWIFEMKKFWKSAVNKTFVCSGQTPPLFMPNETIFICNYEILQYWVPFFKKAGAKMFIADESHYLKMARRKRTMAAYSLALTCQYRILLTGTPIKSKPVDLWSQLRIINSELFPNYTFFIKRYNGAKKTNYGWQFNLATNKEELHNFLINNCMIRILKKDVLKELPEKIRVVIPIEIENRKEYDECKKDLLTWLSKNNVNNLNLERTKKAEAAVKVDKLRQISAKGKLKQAFELINENAENEKIIIFCYHKEILKECIKLINVPFLSVTSETKGEDRQRYVNEFNNNEKIRILISTGSILGTGTNLQSASNIYFIQNPWTASDLHQQESRIHRMGQKNICTLTQVIAVNTIEEKVLAVLDQKLKESNAIIDGTGTEDYDLLTELLNNL